MKQKKSRIELAREIIANLRRGMNRPMKSESLRNGQTEITPFLPMPMPTSRSNRSRPLQTSHSHS
jgi:hypothetical protein